MKKRVMPEELLPALRQYQHNDGSGFVAGFDVEEVIDAFEKVDSKLAYAELLAEEVLALNPKSGELGEGKARNMIALAEKAIDTPKTTR